MTQKLLILSLSFLVLFFVSPVKAIESTTATTGSARPTAPATSASKLKEQMRLLQDQKKAAVSQSREEIRTAIQAKRTEFKERLQTIKDLKRKSVIERIDAKLAEVNKNQTAKFIEVISKLQAIVDKIKQLTTNANVLTDISVAQAAIDSAITAVEAQAAKTYTMTIADDTTLKANAGTTVSGLRQDLTAVHKLVVDAKQAVQKLNTDKKAIRKEATGSANL